MSMLRLKIIYVSKRDPGPYLLVSIGHSQSYVCIGASYPVRERDA